MLKVYARRLWVYDREAYKAKRAVRTFDRTDIIRGSLSWTTTLSGTYTGGTFDYTDADKDCDISCKVGGGTHIKSVNRRAISVQDAAVQLCAELNRANHGTIKLRFTVPGDWTVSAGIRAGDDTAVVVRQHDHGSPDKIGTKDPLAGGVEVVAVAKAVHRRCYLKVLTT